MRWAYTNHIHLAGVLVLVNGRIAHFDVSDHDTGDCRHWRRRMKMVDEQSITDLLVRFWGLGRTLEWEEKEVLLVALDEENRALHGPIHVRALERLKEKGIG